MDDLEKKNLEYVKMAHAEWLEHFRGVREFSNQAIRMLYVLNGGALLALLALLGNMYGTLHPEGPVFFSKFVNAITPAFMPFVFGLLSAGMVSLFAYINFSALETSSPSSAALYNWLRGENHVVSNFLENLPVTTARIGVFFGLGSLAAFGFGCYKVYQAFKLLGA